MNNNSELGCTAKFGGNGFGFFRRIIDIGGDIIGAKIELLLENRYLKSRVRELEKASLVDCTTGIYNKRYLKMRLEEEFARSRRHGLSLSSVFIDIDDFKAINDKYGHVAGDGLLKEIASVIKWLCRSEDSVVRFGGEEFVVLMSATEGDEAVAFAERIRRKISTHIFYCGSIAVSLSVSIGVSDLGGDGFSYEVNPEDLIYIADRAMYMAKEGGKNKTCYLPFEQKYKNLSLLRTARGNIRSIFY
jgi:diguanylate cyclase (GGDEF)-like protein